MSASVRARLLNLARERSIEFNAILDRYTIERFLYRLSVSSEVDHFTLKGAALFRIWSTRELRPTRDVDLLAAMREDESQMRSALEAICSTSCIEDGVVFDADTIQLQAIRPNQRYGGWRARIQGNLGQARLNLQVDIGSGDVITPDAQEQDYPTLLDLPVPRPRLWTYPRETVIAEKLEAMVQRGEDNTRMKDFWDVACLARGFDFDGETLRTAIEETFRRRGTPFGGTRPIPFQPEYYEDGTRKTRWQAMRRRIGPGADGPERFADAGMELRSFLGVVFDSLIDEIPFAQTWIAGGPWLAGDRGRRGGGEGGSDGPRT